MPASAFASAAQTGCGSKCRLDRHQSLQAPCRLLLADSKDFKPCYVDQHLFEIGWSALQPGLKSLACCSWTLRTLRW